MFHPKAFTPSSGTYVIRITDNFLSLRIITSKQFNRAVETLRGHFFDIFNVVVIHAEYVIELAEVFFSQLCQSKRKVKIMKSLGLGTSRKIIN